MLFSHDLRNDEEMIVEPLDQLEEEGAAELIKKAPPQSWILNPRGPHLECRIVSGREKTKGATHRTLYPAWQGTIELKRFIHEHELEGCLG